ncbi:hypothetical protein [Rhizobium jaguaris]|uniref:Uncharacterized protein n=1 Tax=Rhizobium jaguaris TaxID=1312183 RepID=A0A387FL19_9HYPH|nr:hypothetical protein [Rhizobium jaguaris]AYG59013.1 hypothetical protein CCGE525_09550 [Rhizobium jaguaris]
MYSFIKHEVEMQEKRRIQSVAKVNWFKQLRHDPLRMIELGLVVLGTTVAAFSSFFSWQAASATAEQAKYAHEALSAADMNASFRTYIASWNKLCNAITPPEYGLTVGTPFFEDEGKLTVIVTNLGFDRAAFNLAAYVDRIADAEDIARDNLIEFKAFLPEDTFGRTEQALTIIGYFYSFSPSAIGPRTKPLARHWRPW